MPEVNLTEWNHFLKSHPNAHLLQMGEWGELKRGFGWKPVRIISTNSAPRIPNNEIGAQILFRRLPLGLTRVFSGQWTIASDQFWREVDSICKKNHAIFLKIEPDTWDDQFLIPHSSFLISKHNIQPPRTIVISIKDSEEQILRV
ncbi:MAG: hypothetical protein IPN58_05420 [Anaerolineales bacterium]|nr:hypothetical protein [Anaerolineales bacterium]